MGRNGLVRSASVQLASWGRWVDAKLGASSLRSGRRDKRKKRELGGQIMRTETSDSNYNISTAAQSSGKNERNDEAGLKRVWWARAR